MNNNKTVPKLRFPEFKEDGEWEKKAFNEMLDIIDGDRGINYPKSNELNDNGYCLFLNAKNVTKEGFRLNNKQFITKEKDLILRNGKLKKLDVVLTTRGSVGQFAFYNQNISYNHIRINSGMVILRTKSNYIKHLSSYFFYEYCRSGFISSIINNSSFGNAQQQLTVAIIKRFPLLFPINLQEQQKIADCLTSIDDQITLQSQKVEKLKAHKKGLMQKLFPADGENIPKLRFPDFVDDGVWVEKTLGDIASFIKGKGISKSDIIENGSLPCIRYGELYTHYNERIEKIKSYTNCPKEDLVLSQENDVIIPASGETQEDIATASCVLKDDIALGGDLNIIRTLLNGVFLSYYLNNARKKAISNLSQGVSVIHLYSHQLKNLKIQTPLAEEQQKIADCLSSIDRCIELEGKKLELLKEHKKGLMQQLFPAMD